MGDNFRHKPYALSSDLVKPFYTWIDSGLSNRLQELFVKTPLIFALWLALGGVANSSSLLLRAPHPQLTDFVDDLVTRYQDENHKPVFVKIAVAVQNGRIVDSRTYTPSGVPAVDEAVRRWVLYQWKFNSDVSGRFAIPLQIKSQLGLDPVRKLVIFR
jgi:hypothetical protein